ncbi:MULTISPECIES: methyl-accepting chemotaxis protein [unclassified Sedimentibacter]|uniref:methyl-accepting chemotaxis protein n=1 Tax=unclassified Sedimentibacter TaxID=2649220 RepID=UPI0027E00917|nr:methyl-accepting chemotaxis protein [Sedimentibacter sp. MB35-C1]WMJ77752.1 methyl-accepting chemotaxis protein [Sedimentibacter sp. MB35-C1]
MTKLKSIRTKLSLAFGLLILMVCAGLGLITYIQSSSAISSQVDESLEQLTREASKLVKGRTDLHLNALEVAAESDLIKSETIAIDEKLDFLKREVERSGHLSMAVVDINGNGLNTKGETVSVSEREYFKKAMSGEKSVTDPMVNKIDGSIIVMYAVPIKNGSAVKGVLLAGRDGNELSDMVDDIKFGENGEAFMIGKDGTTVAHPNRELVLNMDNDLENVSSDAGLQSLVELEKQMIEGKTDTGEYEYNGITKYMAFTPIEGTNWFLALTSPKSEAMEKVNKITNIIISVSIGFIVVGILVTIVISASISKPIKMASDHLQVLSTGDFTKDIPSKLLKMNDEVGILANAMNTMQQSLSGLIRNVAGESTEVTYMLGQISNEIIELNKSIEEITATTEELSASTEETASATEEMNVTSSEIEGAVQSVANKSQEGAVTANSMNDMAESMKEDAVNSKKEAIEIYERTKTSMENAIKQSKAVEQINVLSEAILEIASQTNLLALNAAIEAARAGEAGKGFAVVADEIRTLAVNSQNTVSRIKEVTQLILVAVNNLSASAHEIMEFIDGKLLKDYDTLVDSSELYSHNSSKINDMVTDFSAASEEILVSMQNMVHALNEVASASTEGAQGATNIAQSTTSIAQMSGEVSKLSESAKEKSNMLIEAVSKIKL